jgi:signal transduction histidine kinase
MDFLLHLLLALIVALLAGLLLRSRRRQDRAFNELPTGVCGVDGERIDHWNRELARLSGIPRKLAVGAPLTALPAPWSRALRDALQEPAGTVVKRAMGEDDDRGQRWILLHSSPGDTPSRRLVLVEDITSYQHLQDELLHKERLASIGRLAAGVAHEIGNPVTGIACLAQNLREGAEPGEIDQAAAEILKQTDRVTRTLNTLMQLSHPGSTAREPELRPCNLADCIDEAVHLLELEHRGSRAVFENRCHRELLVSGDSQLLLQVFINLLDNARSASGDESPVLVDATAAGAHVTVTIDNAGEAIPAAKLEQLFEPFFTTKDVGEGTGLGLPLVQRMLEDMRGDIRLISPSPAYAQRGVRAEVSLHAAHYEDVLPGPA